METELLNPGLQGNASVNDFTLSQKGKFYREKCFVKSLALLNMMIVLVSSVACVSIGAWLSIKRDKVPENIRHFYNPAALLIFNGLSYLAIFIFGIIGLIRDRKVMLVIYIFLLVIMVTLQIITGYFSFLYMQRELQAKELKMDLGANFKNVRFHLNLIGWITYACTIPMVLSMWTTYSLIQKLDTMITVVYKNITMQ